MSRAPGRFAYRCLPLVIANSHGWELLVDQSFAATWSGGSSVQELQVSFLDEKRSLLPASHFGQGVLTFQVGYLFETSERCSLWVAGPINQPKDGIVPLCGVVETDWGPYTFTMNWMFTRPGTVRFERGEPFCHVFPIPRQLLSSVEPEIRDLEDVPEKAAALASWRAAREEVRGRVRRKDCKSQDQVFGMHYFRGQTPDGEVRAPDHMTRLTLKPFRDRTSRQVSYLAEDAARQTASPRSGALAHVVQRLDPPPAERLVRAHFTSNAHALAVEFPDPLLSASITCEGGLDEAVRRAIIPFWLRLRKDDGANQCYLWFLREHERIAIHLHGPEDEVSKRCGWLEEVFSGCSVEWNTYRRSDVFAGSGELLLDHRYSSFLTVCLSHSCNLVLTSLDGTSELTPGSRRTAVFRALLAGLSTLELPYEMRFSYLAYHRDSVLREAMTRGPGSEGVPNAVSSLDSKAEASREAIRRLRDILEEAWDGGTGRPQHASADLGSWLGSLNRLCARFVSSSHHESLAPEPVFAPLFAALHGFANQTGMAPLDEAFLCHLLVRAPLMER